MAIVDSKFSVYKPARKAVFIYSVPLYYSAIIK